MRPELRKSEVLSDSPSPVVIGSIAVRKVDGLFVLSSSQRYLRLTCRSDEQADAIRAA